MEALKLPLLDVDIIDIPDDEQGYLLTGKALVNIHNPTTHAFCFPIKENMLASAMGSHSKESIKRYEQLKKFIEEESYLFFLKGLQETVQEQKQEKKEFEQALNDLFPQREEG